MPQCIRLCVSRDPALPKPKGGDWSATHLLLICRHQAAASQGHVLILILVASPVRNPGNAFFSRGSLGLCAVSVQI